MNYRVVHFERAHVPAAVELFMAAYRQEQLSSPLLPAITPRLRGRIEDGLQDALSHPGMAVCSGTQLLGYMGICAQFDFKGQRAAIVREYAHGSVSQDKGLLYQSLYAALGEELISRSIHLHAVCHLAGDRALRDTLFQLGFGALVAEELRDLSAVRSPAEVSVVREKDWGAITQLAIEHARYYRDSPIFLIKDDSAVATRSRFEEHRQNGDALFVYREHGEPCVYLIVGRCAGEEEGFLLQGSNTAQILSAYARPAARGRGIGRTLLQCAVDWAKGQGYDRLLVEHETANLYGGNFWRCHFAPYLYCSTRYVDCRL